MEKLLAAVAQTHGFDDDEPVVSTPPEVRLENSVIRGENGGSRRIGEVSGGVRPGEVVEKVVPAPMSASPPVGRVIGGGEKRRRGRPPKGQSPANAPPPKRKKVEKVEDNDEDVCFICFDGGSLILCDCKGCPKAYHPACVKRDPSFFNTKAKWFCGWHICRTCEKTSHFMCYTCTYALCKGCIRDGDFLRVRGNKGFCPACMKLVMLYENKEQATNESAQVNFDDKTCFEHFFKMYWLNLKEELSLTLNDLLQAKDPFKGTAVGGEVSNSNKITKHLELNKPHLDSNLTHNDGLRTSLPRNCNQVESLCNDKGEATKESCIKEATKESCIEEAPKASCIKEATKESCIQENQDDSAVQDSNKPLICENTRERELENSGIDSNQWASKDLLEFVAHMKNGDTSPIPQFDVQNLLLDYIKRNNLRDPRRKSQIICDPMLKKLFGKPRVGHIEMLKLLELHFLKKEDSQQNSLIPAGFIGSVTSDAEVEGKSTDVLPTPIKRKKRKSLKNANKDPRDEYAAIDVHNINLVYLRRNLMENLIDDHDNFNDKVIGSFVRIRVPTNDQKPDFFRLVKVAGTRKVAEPYKVGDKTTDVMLEVLNLNNIEVVSIDAISNFEFTEDECRRLRESIRCGLIEGITVDDIQKKAMKLQSVRVIDWLETEVLRLNHLQNRASEKGHNKELREYADRLELLKSPEERQRRISEVPEIHTDPKMNPLYKSDDNTRNGENGEIDGHVGPSHPPYPRNRRKSIAIDKKGKDGRPTKTRNRIINKADPSGSNGLDKQMNQINIDRPTAGDRIKEKADPSGSNGLNKQLNQINIDCPAAGDRIKEKADPSGSNGLDKQINQINIDCPAAADRNDQMSGLETSTATPSTGNSPSADHIEIEKLWHYRDPNGRIQGPFSVMQLRIWSTTGLFPPDMRIWTNHELFDSLLLSDALNGKLHGASDLLDKPPSGSNEATGEIVVPEGTNGEGTDHKQTEGQCGNSTSVPSDKNTEHVTADEPGSSRWPLCWDLLTDSNYSADDVQNRNLLPSSSSGKEDVALTSDEVNHGSQNGEKNSTGLTQNPMTSEQESSEEKMSSINIDLSSNDLVLDSSKWDEKIKALDFPSPTPTAENQQTVLAVEDVPMQESGILELLSPAPRLQKEFQEGQPTETKQPGFTMFPSPMPGWSCDSTPGIGPLQLPEVVDPWCGYSPTPARSEWVSNFKPPEISSECIDTSVSETQNLANASTSQAAPNWLELMNEPIEFDAFGEESVSDLLAEVDAMESRGSFASPTSALKFAREFLEDCNTDGFSSIEDFDSATAQPMKSDAFSSTTDMQLTSQSSAQCKPMGSSASSEGETNASGHSGDAASEFHPHAPQNPGQEMVGTGPGSILDATDPGWGPVQGNINLVTVQGNVNLVLVGGPGQGMGWGSNPGPAWTNPSTSRSPRNASLPWDGQQRKYSGERFSSPRERGVYQGGGDSGFGRGRPQWGRQPYGGSGGGGGGGGGYSRPLPRGQRVCKFYESGHCKKGAFCDYLHP